MCEHETDGCPDLETCPFCGDDYCPKCDRCLTKARAEIDRLAAVVERVRYAASPIAIYADKPQNECTPDESLIRAVARRIRAALTATHAPAKCETCERVRGERDWLADWAVEAIKRGDPAYPTVDEYSPTPTRETVLAGVRRAILADADGEDGE